MTPASPLLSIGRCSLESRSFLHRRLPDGSPAAGAPPGHHLRSGGYMAAIRSGTKGKISPHDVSTLSGEPRDGTSQHTAVRLLEWLCKPVTSPYAGEAG